MLAVLAVIIMAFTFILERKQEAPRLYKMSNMIKVMSQNLSSCGFLLQVHQETQVAQPSRVLKVYVDLMWW